MRSSCSRRRSPPDSSRARRPLSVAAQAEPVEQLAGRRGALGGIERAAHLRDRLPRGQLRIEPGVTLMQVAQPDRLPPDDLAGHAHARLVRDRPTGLLAANHLTPGRQQVQQRALATAVGPDQADPLTRAEPPGHVVEQGPRAHGHADVLRLDHGLTEPRGRHPDQFHPVPRGRLTLDERVGRVHPEPGLAGPGGRPAAKPGQFLAQQVAPSPVGGLGDPGPFRPGQHIRGVPPVVGVHLPVGQFPGPVAHRIQEPAVVGHRNQCLRPPGQVLGQPVDSLNVQVVGGLVQEQQVVLADQDRGQRDPPGLAAGEPVRRGGQVHPGQQGGQHGPGPGVGRPGVLGQVADHDRGHGAGQLTALGQHPGPQPPGAGRPAAVQRLGPGQHRQQGALARAVAADDADPVTDRDPGRYPVQQRPLPVRLDGPLQVDQVGLRGAHACLPLTRACWAH